MCGRLNVSDDPFVTQLLNELGVDNPSDSMRYARFMRATNTLSIVREISVRETSIRGINTGETKGKRVLTPAIWWLLLESTETGFKPSKYTSFNTRYDKLNAPRSAGYKAYRESRCVIVAKGFGETEYQNKKPLHYHDFEADRGAIAFGGLYREWVHPSSGIVTYSCSVITVPPHEKLASYHSKSSPLMLPQHDDTINAWLDPGNTETEMFSDLLQPKLYQDLLVQEIDKPSHYAAVGEARTIKRDARN
mgnify:FL=1